MTDIQEVYRFTRERLDAEYVVTTAAWVANCLRAREPVGVAFQPGDGTRYDLAFFPTGIGHAPGRRVDGEDWGTETSWGVDVAPGTAIVAYQQHGRCVALDFRSPGFEPVYIAELFDVGLASACALTILFNGIAGAFDV